MLTMISPILYVDLLKQASYKTTILLSLMHKQKIYFSKKYSKSNRITLNKTTTNLSDKCHKDNIKAIKYIQPKITINKKIYEINIQNIKVIRYLTNNRYSDYNTDFHCQRHMFMMLCVKHGNIRMIKMLLKNIGRSITMNDYELFRYSVAYNNILITRLLLLYGSDINSRWGYALQTSVERGHIAMAKFLLDNGADIHAKNEKALMDGIIKNNIDMVKLLLHYGADIHRYDNRALRYSASKGYIHIVKLLLDAGAYIHADNESALIQSACHGHHSTVKLLLDSGADVHADDDDLLHIGVENNDVIIVKLALEYGANIHAHDNYAIKYSACDNNIPMTQLLLEAGANINAIRMNEIPKEMKLFLEEK